MEFSSSEASFAQSAPPVMQRSSQSSSEWRVRIRDIQREKVSPELIQRLQENSSRRQRIDYAVKKADILERSNKASVHSSTVSFWRADATPTMRREERQQEYGRIAERNQQRTLNLQSVASNISAGNQLQDIEMFSRQLDEVEAEIMEEQEEVATVNNIRSPIAESSSESEGFESILQSLANEPTDEDEVAAKYGLFENFLNTVVMLRDQTMHFWEENKDQFTGASLRICEKDIRCIDSNDSMGIFDESGNVWFVYQMMRKANDNSKAISKVLNTLKSRLQLLSATALECPFCLDAMTIDTEETLSCCHKTCKDCWANWVQIKGHGAFCPLCKHPQFVEELFQDD